MRQEHCAEDMWIRFTLCGGVYTRITPALLVAASL